jgi:Asp-tRNA(Asn)/Glu-tRNA(Gln) amidotransferase A subunit family amidase
MPSGSSGDTSARASVETSLERAESRIRAWAYLDPDLSLRAADWSRAGPLTGVTLGLKDVFDTSDQPTEYGSPIYSGYQPRADALAVARLRLAGAVVIGKTITAELGWFTPGPTANPLRPTHTPGGSSSGSAAAVAAGMVELALGSQTGGSVIRPASFCGVFGLKPTFGVISTAGVKPAAPTCDTVGLFARDVQVLVDALLALTGEKHGDVSRPIRFAFTPTDEWAFLDDDGRRTLEDAAKSVRAEERAFPSEIVGLGTAQQTVQAYEGVRSLAWERQYHADKLSSSLRGILDWGAAVSAKEYNAVMRRAAIARDTEVLDRLFGAADVLLTPAVPGEAPEGLDTTGDPRFCRLWTLLGLPTISVPGLVGSTGLPVGVQLVARAHHDQLLLAAADHMASVLS